MSKVKIPGRRYAQTQGLEYVNTRSARQTRFSSSENILDAARESQSIRDHGISCDVLEHIQQGVPKLWAGLVSPVRSVPTLD